MNTRDLIKLLAADGWYEVKANSGSHRQYKHPTKPGKVTVPFHGKGADIAPGTLKSVKKQAGLQ